MYLLTTIGDPELNVFLKKNGKNDHPCAVLREYLKQLELLITSSKKNDRLY